MDDSNEKLPWLRLTEFGYSVVEQAKPAYYDPDGDMVALKEITPQIDSVIEQYVLEGLNCFKQRLNFASAVMFGAAAEKAILLLLESIGHSESDPKMKKEAEKLLVNPGLPSIFKHIQTRLDSLIKSQIIPYPIHQGCTEHLLSLFEMIRVHRNEAIHPIAGNVNKTKVFLTIQSLPTIIETIYRLIDWFEKNKI
jgi:hypothetical protein